MGHSMLGSIRCETQWQVLVTPGILHPTASTCWLVFSGAGQGGFLIHGVSDWFEELRRGVPAGR